MMKSPFTSLCIGIFFFSTLGYANGGSQSPTGWRGPVREAGRPWLRSSATPSQSQPSAANHGCAANTWCYDAQRQIYWTYDAETGVYWFFWPQTNSYTYVSAR